MSAAMCAHTYGTVSIVENGKAAFWSAKCTKCGEKKLAPAVFLEKDESHLPIGCRSPTKSPGTYQPPTPTKTMACCRQLKFSK